ncbi:MAG: potassium channel family protein [Candidatus Pacearchaeota archaeon]
MVFKIKNREFIPHEHKHVTKGLEFVIAILIAVALIGSLTSTRYIDLPRYVIPLLIILFISLKVVHIIKQGGSLLEDYMTLAVMLLFIILDITLKGDLNGILITGFIVILIYSTGLMFWVKSKLGSKKITHFLISYITAIFMIIFLFAGAYISNPEDFVIQGVKKSITFEEALYYSTVTITTVGYGDITPASKVNRFLSATEAFLGMTLNVALLGYVLSTSREPNQD